MAQGGKRIVGLSLKLELRFWEMRNMLKNWLLATFGADLLFFRLWEVNGNGGCFRPSGDLVKRDILA